MIVTTVVVKVKPEFVELFILETLENHKQSVLEPGNLRFDILQTKEWPEQFLLYEAYESEEAAAAHKLTTHYLAWREKVAPWMAEPRVGTVHTVLAPTEKERW